ncbi:MAG: hypothetical protein EKK37_00235 [Sphingobacteriales bacterium]|nr:MAG: hypothetical protein EKK37_00235 [Sphingobacteriales bacterium]
MNAIFTIVAKNYTGLAQVLESSVRKHSEADFFIVVGDEWDGVEELKQTLPSNVITAKEILNIPATEWDKMAFKYNLVEFCTSIKAASFQYLFTKGYNKILYFDPDIYVFNSLQIVFDQLNETSIVVTPHILNVQTPFKGNYEDYLFLLNGTFNLGFIGLKKSETTDKFLAWWHHRLVHHCFFDNDQGTATDQKWINLLPAVFGSQQYHISGHRGMNAAPWNFHERKVLVENGVYFIQDREDETAGKEPLVFVHFSGYDYSQIGSGQVVHKNNQMTDYDDLQPVFEKYGEALANSNFKTYSGLRYSYNMYENGVVILSLHRRMYRRLLELNMEQEHPFSTGEGTYFAALKKKGLLDYSPVSADKLTNKTVKNFGKKFAAVHLFFTIIKKLVGIRRYSIMIRFFRRYLTEENQAFLVNKEAGKILR